MVGGVVGVVLVGGGSVGVDGVGLGVLVGPLVGAVGGTVGGRAVTGVVGAPVVSTIWGVGVPAVIAG